MIGNTVLRIIICPYPLRSVARTYKAAPLGRFTLVLLPLVHIVKARLQHAHRLLLVLRLRFLVLALHDEPRRYMRYAYRALRFVDVLSARAARTVCVYAQILLIYFYLDILGLGKHSDRRRARVYAPLRFRLGHALDAMYAAFKFKLAVCRLALQAQHGFLNAAHLRLGYRYQLCPHKMTLGIPLVHPQKHSAEQRRFVAARAGANLYHYVPVVVRVFRKQKNLQFFVQALLFHVERRYLLMYHGPHVAVGLVQHRIKLVALRTRRLVLIEYRHYLLERRMLLQAFLPHLPVVHGVG